MQYAVSNHQNCFANNFVVFAQCSHDRHLVQCTDLYR